MRQWFRAALGRPTPAQEQGWPSIAAGQHTLILAPTGSGKTLAAFLACLDFLWRQESVLASVKVLYISPLKALNNDIHRNLQVPLEGVAETARQLNHPLPTLACAVRTGDTPMAERQRLVRHPPQVLITTPESLHLMLTSKARDTLRRISYCIVDEIHALCTNKRGVFLALLLERLSALNPQGFVRIGLSATQRPLEEVARYLGGQEWTPEGELRPRPVTIVDAGLRKEMDLQVVSPVEQFGPQPEKSIWPAIYRLLYREVTTHRSTIIFANSRRGVERITAHLNAAAEMDCPDNAGPKSLARAHHGSVSLEMRRATEEALKEGRLPAVVATASLELGIDMGAVELVCQVESPGNVSRGLQRVGRAGHLVGRTSKGRLIPKTPGDLLEQAVLAREMAAGNVEACRVPVNCLDVLAQQIVAMTAMDSWPVPELLTLVRQAYPFRELAPAALEVVLEMISGRFRFDASASNGDVPAPRPGQTMNALQPRISWDRVHNRLHALPGSQQLALVHGGTIPDTGQYAVYTSSNVRLGELDEEFIYERRVGEAFLLGTNTWRIEQIGTDRVVVSPAEGAQAVVPFWRGEQGGRSHDLGLALAHFLRELNELLDAGDCQDWLRQTCHLDSAAARSLRWHVLRQRTATGCLPTDRTIYVEAFRDPLGDWQVIVLNPLGSQVNLGLRLAVENRLEQRLGYRPQCLHHDDGILVRLTDSEEPVLDVLHGITADNVGGLITDVLADTPLFALRFRQNASRALLLPTGGAGQRAPLWLQRLRGRDLLQVARRHPDFPIVVETFRECLQDYLDLSHLQELLARIATGTVDVVTRRSEAPSPFAAHILFAFTAAYMYQYDDTELAGGAGPALDRQMLDQLLSPSSHPHLLDPRAIQQVERRLRGMGRPPRSSAEMAEWLRRLGDLAGDEVDDALTGWLRELEQEARVCQLQLPGSVPNPRWLLAEEEVLYRQAFGMAEVEPQQQQQAAETILLRFLTTHALVSLADILTRYPFDPDWAKQKLQEWSGSGRLVPVAAAQGEPLQWSAPENLEQVERGSLSLLRREVVTAPPQQFADFLTYWQRLAPQEQREQAGLRDALESLEGALLPAALWEQVLLPARVANYQPRWLDDLLSGGEWTWFCRGDGDNGPGQLAFVPREHLAELTPPAGLADVDLGDAAAQVLECLRQQGAQFVVDLSQRTGLAPATVRSALWELLRQGVATNDRFDVIRKGEPVVDVALRAGAPLRRGVGRRGFAAPEGRWSLLPWGTPTAETQALLFATLLLRRHGVAARELALADPLMPPWRVLYEVLSRMELAGEVRRGYFVEGLSGAQFALPDAARLLRDRALPSLQAPPLLLHSLDPANLYGSGAPFDIPLLDGGTQPFLRRSGNWLVLCAGRPVLLIEQQGQRLTALNTSAETLAAAVALLPRLLALDHALMARRKLAVRQWNGQSIIGSAGQSLLEQTGFVRDYQDMTLYAGWTTPVLP